MIRVSTRQWARMTKPKKDDKQPAFRLRPSKIKLKEADVAGACLTFLIIRGWFPYRIYAGLVNGNRRSANPAGIEDWVFLRRSSGIAIEFKRPKGKQSQDQLTRETLCRKARLRRWVIDSLASLELRYYADFPKERPR